MSLNIFFSSSTTTLARKLSGDLDELYAPGGREREGFDALKPVAVLVPNRNMEKWLRFNLSREGRIVFNLGFPYLENGLWDLVHEIRLQKARAVGRPVSDVQMSLPESLVSMIAARLLADSADPAHEGDVLVRYCLTGGGPASPGFCIRLWQVAGRLARLFREYEYSRTDMVRQWMRDEVGADSRPMAREQSRIYRLVSSPQAGFSAGVASGRASLFQLAEDVFADHRSEPWPSADSPGGAGDSQRPVYIFGMSSLSRYHCQLFWDISRYRDVRIYHVNNCHEFWEDLTSSAEDRWKRIRQAGKRFENEIDEELDFVNDLDENQLLKAWGRAGRETVRLLAELEYSGLGTVQWLEDSDELEDDATVLARVRHGIRERTSAVGRCRQDDSVEIWNCPGKLREVETIAERITGLLGTDPSLRLSDIAVLVSDIGAYKHLIAQVFDRDKSEKSRDFAGPFPYNLADSNASADSLYAQAVKALLGLVGSDYSRKKVFDLLFNPCFQEGAGVSAATVDIWASLAEKLGVFHDFVEPSCGDGDAAPAPDAPLKPFSWSQALVRLRLGRVMSNCDERLPDTDDSNPFGRIYPADGGGLDSGGADSFCEKLEMLFSRLDSIRGSREPVSWQVCLKKLFDEFLGIPNDRTAEALIRNALFAGLDRYFGEGAGLDASLAAIGGLTEIPHDLAFEVVRSLLGDIPTSKGAYLSDGITVASLKPMRPIPFRVVFVAGMEEGAFPGAARESSLDLRFPGRRIGDVATPDAGRYMFMETLLATGEKLILTYDGWDIKKDAKHEPCSVVRQLKSFITESVLSPGEDGKSMGFETFEVPIAPSGGMYLRKGFRIEPSFRRLEDRALACLVEAGRARRTTELLDTVRAAMVCPGREKDRVLKRMEAALEGAVLKRESLLPDPVGTEPVRIRIKDLASFLDDPMKARLQRFFNTWESDGDDGTQVEDEAFEYGDRKVSELVVRTLKQLVSGQLPPDGVELYFRGSARGMYLRSVPPALPFAKILQDELLEKFDEAAQKIVESLSGRPMSALLPDEKVAISVDGRDFVISLNEGVDFITKDVQSGNPGYCVVKRAGTLKKRGNGLFAPFVYGLVTCGCSSSFKEHGSFDAIEVSSTGVDSRTLHIDSASARAALEALILDYLDDSVLLEQLPYQVVHTALGAKSIKGREPFPSEVVFRREIQDSIKDLMNPDGWGHYFPTPGQRLLADWFTLPDNLLATVRRRYGLFWRLLHGEAAGGQAK